ncbi:hypothetical protein ACFSQ7_37935 [Paenibacillus rhizoplanae]
MSKRYAAVAITRSGIELAVKLGGRLGGTEVFVYAKYSGGLEARSGEITVFLTDRSEGCCLGSSGATRRSFCSSRWGRLSG